MKYYQKKLFPGLLSIIFVGSAFSSFSVNAKENDPCTKRIEEIQKQINKAEMNLNNTKEIEGMMLELSEEARDNRNFALRLFIGSAATIAGGLAIPLARVGSAQGPILKTIEPFLEKVLGQSAIASIATLVTPPLLAAGAYATSVLVDSGLVEEDITVEQLIGPDKNFDKAQETVKNKKAGINLNYSQATDILGLRDRYVTKKLHLNAQQSREIEQLRVEHLELTLSVLKEACRLDGAINVSEVTPDKAPNIASTEQLDKDKESFYGASSM